MRHALLFCFTLFATLLAGFAEHVYGLWTGGLSLWPVAVPAIAVGLILALLAARFTPNLLGAKSCAGLGIFIALFAFAIFGNTVALVKDWTLLSLRIGLTYEAWHRFVLQQALLWCVPIAVGLPFIGLRNGLDRGRRITFIAACVGLILARCLVGRVSSFTLLSLCLAGLLLSAPLSLAMACAHRWSKSAACLLAALLLFGWYTCSLHSPYELVGGVNPFATIAARDSYYLGTGSAGVTLREGRVIQALGLNEASQLASQLIPTLLRPNPQARIAARTQAGDPYLPTYETGKLKGLYDALWIAVPPAWLAEETDFFGANALETVRSHLKEDGILVYDLDARALDARMLLERLSIIRKRFPYAQLWMTGLNSWQIVASAKPITANFSTIADLPDLRKVGTALTMVGLHSPIFLLSSCVCSDPATLDAALQETIPPRIPRGEHRHARKLLFDGRQGWRLLADFARVYDTEMPWVAVPDETASETRTILLALREARRKAMLGDFRESSKANPTDPFVLGLADRELRAARDHEKLAEHQQALDAYARAFALAQPALLDVWNAAEIARKAGLHERCEAFYRLAHELDPENLHTQVHFADFLLEIGRYAEAEKLAQRVIKTSRAPEDLASARFFESRCIAHQTGRATEGLQKARTIAANATTPETKAVYIPAYGQLLIDVGHIIDGVKVKRHYQAHGELLPKAEEVGR